MPSLDPDLRSLQEVRDLVERASRAQAIAARWSQKETDAVCEAMAKAGANAAHDLARVAVDETGMGRVHYKVLKNLFGAEGTWDSIKDERTVGILSRDERSGVIEVGTPAGVIAVIIPTTNPTSTALNNALICVKGRNAVVISPHPRAKRCIGETVDVLRRAIERAGGPPDLVCTLSNPTIESTGALMKHRKTAMILATGGSGLVRSAYSSGKPAYGVGPGNVPVYVDRSADVDSAARWIVASQSFDNATLCCSEQALVLDRPIAERVLSEMQRRGAYLCNADETEQLERHCVRDGMMVADVVGQDPWKIAQGAGFDVPRSTTVLLAHQGGVGKEYPLSSEVLCPLLSIHVVDGWEDGCSVSLAILRYGGLGHTIGLWAKDETVLDAWFLEKPANRIVVNGPTSQGAVGYSTGLPVALSLGCGPQAGNITSDNLSARHMINVKRVAFVRADWESTYEKDLARAASLTGDHAPRGSGLVGDPALRGTGSSGARPPERAAALTSVARPSATGVRSSTAGEAVSNWHGNPPTHAIATQPTRAPRFTSTQPSAAVSVARVAQVAPVAPVAQATPPERTNASAAADSRADVPTPGPYVGMSLTTDEIKGILAHAGAGCPLGPCKGCPHNDVRTGACTA